jgi:hypothetical protein
MAKKLFLTLTFILPLFFWTKEVLAAIVISPINVPSEVTINQTFNIQGEITGVQTGQFYYLKCRLGLSSSNLNEGQTYNSVTGSWLSDTNDWSGMPSFEVTNNSLNFSFPCRVKPGIESGDKIVFLRACLKQADGSCNSSFQSTSGVTMKALTEIIPTSTPTSLPSSTPTPTMKIMLPMPTPKPAATYKINEVKDKDGEILSNVKVYIDDVYLHHYTPEVVTLCDGCQCDDYVSCGFGQHTIKLEKTGYDNWQEDKVISSGEAYEVNPVMVFSSTGSTPTATPTLKPTTILTVTPNLKITPTPVLKSTSKIATESGTILGEKSEATPAFYPLEETASEASSSINDFGKSNFWPKLFFSSALVFLFFASFWVWYNLRTRD